MAYYTCYIATDDPITTDIIAKIVDKAFPQSQINKYVHGLDLIDAISLETGNALVICEFNIDGLNGLQILKKVKSEFKINDSYFILLINSNDKENQIKAVQYGVDDILFTPLAYEQLVFKLKTCSKFVSKIVQFNNAKDTYNNLNEELNVATDNLTEILRKIYLLRTNSDTSAIARVKQMAEFIAKNLLDNDKQINEVVKAAELCFLPQLLLPDKYLGLPVYSDGLVKIKIFEEIPELLNNIFSGVSGLSTSLNIINHINENYDGTGFPDKLQGPEIPVGSRILRVIMDFEYQSKKHNGKVNKTLNLLWESMNKTYDFRIIAFLDQFFANINCKYSNSMPPLEIKAIPNELKNNMVLSRDVIVISGHKLVTAGTILNPDIIESLLFAYNTDSVLGNIYIKNITLPQSG
ncbi:MAG TPA: HD domain-containing phosphohydrolase [Candidatus Kapabacteria bacterium]|nr:HD domain-containing phosphohydrolase [Candidatus Kapabacteria bacterium]